MLLQSTAFRAADADATSCDTRAASVRENAEVSKLPMFELTVGIGFSSGLTVTVVMATALPPKISSASTAQLTAKSSEDGPCLNSAPFTWVIGLLDRTVLNVEFDVVYEKNTYDSGKSLASSTHEDVCSKNSVEYAPPSVGVTAMRPLAGGEFMTMVTLLLATLPGLLL